ncbi:MAG: PKD domain-containing protein [Bacteroidetes bacterium]|nr:PKD domain-containing protein [Bacteroidota bacterium]
MKSRFFAVKPLSIRYITIVAFLMVFRPLLHVNAQQEGLAKPNPLPRYFLGTQLVPDGDTTSAIFDHAPNTLVTTCSNSDFSEENFSNWSGCYGGFSTPCENVGLSETRHVIMPRANQEYDPFIGAPLTTLYPGEVFGARLGDTLEGGHSEQLRYTVSVSPEHFLFIYRWASVLESVGHEPWQMPKFSLQVEDMAGNPIGGDCGFYEFVAPNCSPPGPSCVVPPEWHYFPVVNPAIILYWHDWTTIALDLSSFEALGSVQIVFTTRGCAMQIHRGYAYLSTYCSPLAIQIGMCAGSPEATLTAPPGFTTYAWRGPGLAGPPVGSAQSVIISNPQPNDMYYVDLTAANGCEVKDLSQEILATVINTNFTAVPHCAGEATSFQDISTINQNDVVYWHWIFGDGKPDLGGIPNPTHVYDLPGTYTVTLNAYSTEGCLGTISHPITIGVPSLPTLTGPLTTCANGPGLLYTTEPGMTNYVWTFPAGTIPVAGGTSTSNTATLSWSSADNYTVGVNYTNPLAACNAINPATVTVAVGALSPPVITGENPVCMGVAEKTYTTQPGKINYTWIIPPQATKTDGGNLTDNFVTVTWNTVGTYNISVNYIEPVSLCVPVAPAVYPVTVTVMQQPSFISGEPTACVGVGVKTYITEPGKVNYTWTIPPEADISDGGTAMDNFVKVTWNTAGSFSLSVNYSEPVTLCSSALPAIYPVVVNPVPVPSLTGDSPVCLGNTGTMYTTQPGMTNYAWTIPPEAHLDGGGAGNENFASVTWLTEGSYTLEVSYTIPGSQCTAVSPATKTITVNAWPAAAGDITGPNSVCRMSTVDYSVPAIQFAASCQWAYSGTGIVIANNGSSAISITFTASATDGALTVKGINSCGDGVASPPLPIVVHDLPVVSFIPCFDLFTTPNARKFTLRGGSPYYPGQGVFSGNRVRLNAATGLYEFNPLGATPGIYPIAYTYTNAGGCSAAAAPISITVLNNPFVCGGGLTDIRDGKKYKTVFLSGHCWLKENLAYGMYLNSPGVAQTDNCRPEKYCSPADAGCTAYGGLYQWDELMDYSVTPSDKGICPPEWHVPSEAEWQSLIDNLVAGIPLSRTNSTLGAVLKDAQLTDGFLAMLGGLEYNNSYWAFFSESFAGTMFWTSTACGAAQAVARGTNTMNPSISWYCNSRANAFSQRCVKD